MQKFDISKADRRLLLPQHRRFQASVSKLANAKLGLAEESYINGIFKVEGGVMVNGREIAIKADYVVDDWGVRGAAPATPEEAATVEAMLEIVELVKSGQDMPATVEKAQELHGDNLWMFFRGAASEAEAEVA